MKKTFKEFSCNAKYNDIQQKIIDERSFETKTRKRREFTFIPIAASFAALTFVVAFTTIHLTKDKNTNSSNVITKDENSDDDSKNNYLVAIIPQQITINGKTYNMIDNSKEFKSNNLIGYIANTMEKVERLKSENQNSDLFYILDTTYFDRYSDSIGKFYSLINYDDLRIIGLSRSESWTYFKAED